MCKPTNEQLKEHYLQGVGENCLVCDQGLVGVWTDYNGEVRCCECGTTYQILGDHLNDDFRQSIGIEKGQIAQRYCNVFEILPLLRDYWSQVGKRVPMGWFLGPTHEITEDERKSFYDWLRANSDKYEADYLDDFYWDALLGREAATD